MSCLQWVSCVYAGYTAAACRKWKYLYWWLGSDMKEAIGATHASNIVSIIQNMVANLLRDRKYWIYLLKHGISFPEIKLLSLSQLLELSAFSNGNGIGFQRPLIVFPLLAHTSNPWASPVYGKNHLFLTIEPKMTCRVYCIVGILQSKMIRVLPITYQN